jgi:hypothetical protein
MSCLGCSSEEEPICARCRSILQQQEKTMKADKFEDLTPRTLCYMLALQGLLASGRFYTAEPIQIAYVAIDAVDALFEAMEKDNE